MGIAGAPTLALLVLAVSSTTAYKDERNVPHAFARPPLSGRRWNVPHAVGPRQVDAASARQEFSAQAQAQATAGAEMSVDIPPAHGSRLVLRKRKNYRQRQRQRQRQRHEVFKQTTYHKINNRRDPYTGINKSRTKRTLTEMGQNEFASLEGLYGRRSGAPTAADFEGVDAAHDDPRGARLILPPAPKRGRSYQGPSGDDHYGRQDGAGTAALWPSQGGGDTDSGSADAEDAEIADDSPPQPKFKGRHLGAAVEDAEYGDDRDRFHGRDFWTGSAAGGGGGSGGGGSGGGGSGGGGFPGGRESSNYAPGGPFEMKRDPFTDHAQAVDQDRYKSRPRPTQQWHGASDKYGDGSSKDYFNSPKGCPDGPTVQWKDDGFLQLPDNPVRLREYLSQLLLRLHLALERYSRTP